MMDDSPLLPEAEQADAFLGGFEPLIELGIDSFVEAFRSDASSCLSTGDFGMHPSSDSGSPCMPDAKAGGPKRIAAAALAIKGGVCKRGTAYGKPRSSSLTEECLLDDDALLLHDLIACSDRYVGCALS